MKKTFNLGSVKFKADAKKDTIKITIGRAEKEIRIIDLWGIVFSLVNSELKDKIMPVKKEEVMKFKKVHTVELKNDMKKGETLQFTCNIDVPLLIKEGMKNLITDELSTEKDSIDSEKSL